MLHIVDVIKKGAAEVGMASAMAWVMFVILMGSLLGRIPGLYRMGNYAGHPAISECTVRKEHKNTNGNKVDYMYGRG